MRGMKKGRPLLAEPLIALSARQEVLVALERHLAEVHLGVADQVRRLKHLQLQVDQVREVMRQLTGQPQ
jgi:hypothetical protein